VKNQEYRIYNLQNIRYEMEEKEAEAWQKLIRVMAHEIMNSITPITSLSESSLEILRKDNQIKIPSEMSDKEMQKIADALATIE
jgi:nitrogen fixation/metabolism regulation signal transduction histidine kinase